MAIENISLEDMLKRFQASKLICEENEALLGLTIDIGVSLNLDLEPVIEMDSLREAIYSHIVERVYASVLEDLVKQYDLLEINGVEQTPEQP